MDLNNLKPKKGARHVRKRVGRGPGSGNGKTAGRGEKGQKSRSGYSSQLGFEGGQMPLQRRIPKRGFTNPFKVTYDVVRLDELDRLPAGSDVSHASLVEAGLARSGHPVKVLANGAIAHAITVKGIKVSTGAKEKIVAAGGRVED